MKRILFFSVNFFFISAFSMVYSQPRTEFLLEKNWKFTRDDPATAMVPGFDDSNWQTVTVPHDWAIYGSFDANNDLQKMVIVQDGQQQAQSHAGRTGGLPFIGTGWYRLKFAVPGFVTGKKVSILFDGAMSNAVVWINGRKAGYWPYGYNSFHFDITDFLIPGQENLLAVRLENYPESSRWYPGAGIYRNVHVIVTESVHVPVWGTQITTPVIRNGYAKVNLKTTVEFPAGVLSSDYSLHIEIRDAGGKAVASEKTGLTPYDGGISHILSHVLFVRTGDIFISFW